MRYLLAPAFFLSLFAQDIPRPEYPQPQFEREQWQSLNGPWEFDFDDANQGLKEDWSSGARKFSRSILVPFCFESKKSGIGDPSFHPWVWYRRTFTVPAAWKTQRVLLHFGAVDYFSAVWINGKAAGSHTGGNTPFRLDITPYLKAGANTIVLRAEDPPTDRSIPRGKQYWEPKSRSIFYTRTTGIWQPVWIEAAGDTYLESVQVHAGLDGTVRFDGRVANAAPELQLSVTIRRNNTDVSSGAGAVNGKYAAASAVVLNPALWSVDRPNLYDVVFEIRKGAAVVDRVKSYFGFRKVAVENGRIYLNNRPIYLKAVLDQGYWPESTLTPPNEDAIQYDIRMTKEMGFNAARKHQKLEDPRFLYWADKMGLLVSSEMANAYLFDEQYVSRFTQEWSEAVERDINHPSIIIWVPINESWGVPNMRDPKQQAHQKAMYLLTKSLDPTRLVIDNDGWEHTELTDLFAVHDYTATEEGLMKRWSQWKPGMALPPNGMQYLAHGYSYNGTPLYLSEFGGIAFIPQGSQVPAESWGYSGVEKTVESAMTRLQGQYRAILASPFAGICYTQITDVEQEVNGLMTYDRKPKFPVDQLRKLNDTLR